MTCNETRQKIDDSLLRSLTHDADAWHCVLLRQTGDAVEVVSKGRGMKAGVASMYLSAEASELIMEHMEGVGADEDHG